MKTKWQKNGALPADDMQSEKVYTGTIHNRANRNSAALKGFERGAFVSKRRQIREERSQEG